MVPIWKVKMRVGLRSETLPGFAMLEPLLASGRPLGQGVPESRSRISISLDLFD
jgi:hypothetical protein